MHLSMYLIPDQRDDFQHAKIRNHYLAELRRLDSDLLVAFLDFSFGVIVNVCQFSTNFRIPSLSHTLLITDALGFP